MIPNSVGVFGRRIFLLSQVHSFTISPLSMFFFFFNRGQEEARPQTFQQMEITFPDCPCWTYNYHNSAGCQWKCSTSPWIPCQVPLWRWFPMATHHYRNTQTLNRKEKKYGSCSHTYVCGGHDGKYMMEKVQSLPLIGVWPKYWITQLVLFGHADSLLPWIMLVFYFLVGEFWQNNKKKVYK